MATTVAALIAIVRRHLNEPTADFWSDAELASLMNLGAKDLQRSINDNFQGYFQTENATVAMAANATELSSVPSDVGIVRGLEPADLTARPGIIFEWRDYNGIDFQRARSLAATDPSYGLKIFYFLTGAGAPVSTPTIKVAPKVTTALTLRLTYVPTLAQLVASGAGAGQTNDNPVPGESDNALVCWTTAYAMAKDKEDRQPDAGWLALYGTEKANILTSLTPRQTEDEQVAEAFFEDYW